MEAAKAEPVARRSIYSVVPTRVLEQHYKVGEAARLVSVDRSTIRRALAEGRRTKGKHGIYPTAQIRGMTRIPASSLHRWCGASLVIRGSDGVLRLAGDDPSAPPLTILDAPEADKP